MSLCASKSMAAAWDGCVMPYLLRMRVTDSLLQDVRVALSPCKEVIVPRSMTTFWGKWERCEGRIRGVARLPILTMDQR